MKKRDRQTKDSQSEPVVEAPPDPATYVATGNIEQDLPILCKREDVSEASWSCLPGVKPQLSAPPSELAAPTPALTTGKSGKAAKDKAAAAAAAAEAAALEAKALELEEAAFADPSAPKTYKIEELTELIKRVYQVRFKAEEDRTSVEVLRVSKWRLTTPYVTILLEMLPFWKELTNIQLVNTDLSAESLQDLVGAFQEHLSTSLRCLVLDGNTITDSKPILQLLQEPFNVTQLSLRSSATSDDTCKAIAVAVGNNTTLRILDLSLNQIGDDGAMALAKALRFNRTLVMLSLIGNNIGDPGAGAFAEMLQIFELTHEEVVRRRDLLAMRRERHPTPADPTKNPGSICEQHSKSPASGAAAKEPSKAGGKGGKKMSHAQEPAKSTRPKEDKVRKGTESSMKRSRGVKSQATNSRNSVDVKSEAAHDVEPHCALMDDVEPMDGKQWCFGNLVLASLTLAENRHMTEISADQFLESLQYQAFVCRNRKAPRQGLLRLNVSPQHTSPHIEQESETDPPVEVPAPLTDTWLEIQELLAELDPVKLKKRRQEEMEAAALAASNAEAAAQSAAP